MNRNLCSITRKLAGWSFALTIVLAVINILVIGARAHEGLEHVIGTVVSVGDNVLAVKTLKGSTVEVRVDAKTEYAQGKQAMKFSDIRTGNRIVVHAMRMNGSLVAHEVSMGARKAEPTTAKISRK